MTAVTHGRLRHDNESAISAVSVTLVGVIAAALILLGRAPDVQRNVVLAHAPEQTQPAAAAARRGAERAGPRSFDDPRMAEIDRRFQQAVVMLHAGRYDDAVTALHRVMELSPRLPEAHVNMGYALIGLEQYEAARDFFNTATELSPYQANAYWGLGVALEAMGDLRGALGAMRTYIHLSPPDDPYVRKARAALWEWDARLARGPRPEHEQEWIEERTRQWEARNSPDRDAPERGDTEIRVKELQ